MSLYFLGNALVVYFLLIGVGLVLFVVAVAFLVWLVRSGQLDDVETPALRMLHDDGVGAPAEQAPLVGAARS